MQDNAVVAFIKRHPTEVGAGAVACLFVFFALIMGPADLLDAALRRRRSLGRDRAIDRIISGRHKDEE